MITRNITISKDKAGSIQRLIDILPQIPSNCILYKLLTGIGATYSEIKALRHSIILEPNVPTVDGKHEKHHEEDNLFGVKEGIYTEDIVVYLQTTLTDGKIIKIITTPESFKKVKDAFEELELDIYSMCFFLYDECHRLIKDVDYRENIALPMDDFFLFDNKALVSATPLQLLDPRFRKQKFEGIKIVPQFEYKEDIVLAHTNNTLEALKEILSNLEKQQTEERSICLAINSTDMIYQFITKLKIENRSTVFCANKSVSKLKEKDFTCAYENFDKDKMKKYNFFTSRFYTGLDVELDEKPDIVFVTDTYFAEHSMVDPLVDTTQFVGRFRNGVSYIIHIYNTNEKLAIRNKNGILEYLKGAKGAYLVLKRIYDCATSLESRAAYKAALDILPYNRMLDKIGKTNYYMLDNYIDEALLKSTYNNPVSVMAAYKNENSIFIPSILYNTKGQEHFYYKVKDSDRLVVERKSDSIREKRREIVDQLELLKDDTESELVISYINDLKRADPFIVKAYETIGKEGIEINKYSTKRINESMIMKQYSEKIMGTEFLQLIKNSFRVESKYTRKYVKEELLRIHGLVKIAPRQAITAETIKEFFITKDCKIKNSRALKIIESII